MTSVETHFQGRTADTADLPTTLLRSSGRDDKGEGGASIECGCRTEAIFHHWAGRRPMTSPVEMTKGRAALPATVVAEQDPLFYTSSLLLATAALIATSFLCML